MAFTLAVLLSFIPAFAYAAIAYWLDRFEKEPAHLLFGAFIWGALVATGGAIIWTSVLQLSAEALTGDVALADLTGTTLFAPIVEESLKGLAVAIIFVAFPDEFDSVLDGMLYGAITALGFAATENVLYLFFAGYGDGGYPSMIVLFVLRVILGGWGHAVYTSFIGIGLAVARLRPGRAVKLIAPLLGWVVAVFLHALHNTMATFLAGAFGLGGLAATLAVDWLSWVVALAVVFWAIFRERRWIREYLQEEVASGLLTPEQYRTACSIRGQLGARMRGHQARRFYETCSELAQKKHQLAVLGDERGNAARISRLRSELAQLAPAVAP
jgi:RsiW-degrading membrane proteinase PrsW (M82 family)